MGNSWSNTSQTSLTLPTGAVSGARIVIDGTGDAIYVYGPSGDLVSVIAATAGTDPADGKAYKGGITVLAESPGSGEIHLDPNGSRPVASFVTGAADELASGGVYGVPAANFVQLNVVGPTNANNSGFAHDQMSMEMNSSSDDGTSFSAGYVLSYTTSPGLSGGTQYRVITADHQGAEILGTIVAQAAGATVPTVETWHALTPSTGWQDLHNLFPSIPPAGIRLMPDGTFRTRGGIVKTTAGAPAGGTVIATVPTAVSPVQDNRHTSPVFATAGVCNVFLNQSHQLVVDSVVGAAWTLANVGPLLDDWSGLMGTL